MLYNHCYTTCDRRTKLLLENIHYTFMEEQIIIWYKLGFRYYLIRKAKYIQPFLSSSSLISATSNN
jgi:hypothetical protein